MGGWPEPADGTFEALTAAEAVTLEAILGRLIPSGDDGLGAVDAGVVRYVDRVLARGFADLGEYRAGLRAVEAHCAETYGAPLAALADADRDLVLAAMEAGSLPGDSQSFFELVRTHALEGMFGDPVQGGNHDLVGWRLLGYPGPRIVVPAADQRLDVHVGSARPDA